MLMKSSGLMQKRLKKIIDSQRIQGNKLKKPGFEPGFFYAQDKVRPGTGREGALGYVRYIATGHMEKSYFAGK